MVFINLVYKLSYCIYLKIMYVCVYNSIYINKHYLKQYDMKKHFLLITLAFCIQSCRFDDQGDLSIAPWFWAVLAILFVIIVVSAVSGSKDMKHVEEHLKLKGLKVSDFKKCGAYVGGHPLLNETIQGMTAIKQEDQLMLFEFPSISVVPKHKANIPIDKITNIQVEDSSSIEKKLTIGRLFLVGIFAFAWKKKKKNELAFVTIQWKDKFENNTIFSFEGKDAMQNANTARNALINLCG